MTIVDIFFIPVEPSFNCCEPYKTFLI